MEARSRYGFLILVLALVAGTLSGPTTVNAAESGLWITDAVDASRPALPSLEALPADVAAASGDDPAGRRDYELSRLADPTTGLLPTNIFRLEQEFARQLPSWPQGSALADALGGHAKGITGWTWRGPRNIGGRTRALAIDVADATSNTLLAGGVSGGMWRTVDGGATWQLTTGSSQLHSVTAVAQDTRPGQESTWYYGTGEWRGNSAGEAGAAFRGDGIFESHDGGASWTVLSSTSTGDPQNFDQDFDYVWRLATDPTNLAQAEVYAATYGGIHRSVDGGSTWSLVLGDSSVRSAYTDVLVTSAGVVYATLDSAGGVKGIFRSVDGLSWFDITPTSITEFGRIVLAVAPSNENIVYALVADQDTATNGANYHGLHRYTYLSGDGSGAGGSWIDRSANIQALPDRDGPGNWAFLGYGGYCQTIAVQPNDPDVVTIGGVHLVRSTDGFATVTQTTWIGGWTYTDHHADVHRMLFEPGSSIVAFTGSDGGVHRTDDLSAASVVWTPLNNDYRTSQFYSVAIDENDPGNDIVIGGMQDNGTWWTNDTNGSGDWIEQLGGDGSYCAIADASTTFGTYYFSVQRGVIYRFTVDNTGAWWDWTRVDPDGGGSYQFINPFVVDPNDTRILYVSSNNGIWRCSDATAIPLWQDVAATTNWEQLTTTPANDFIGALDVARDGSRSLFYGTLSGKIFELANAHSAAAPSAPVQLNAGSTMPAGYLSSIFSDPNDSDILLVSLSNYNLVNLWYTEDRGATWTAVEGNLGGTNSPSVRSVAMIDAPGSARVYFAATSTGLYSTYLLDGANTVWRQEASGLIGNVVVDMLKVRPADARVVAATHGKGVYSLQVPVGTPTTPAVAPLSVLGNAPNPFNPRTRLRYSLDRGGHAKVVVRDVAGRKVRVLVDATLPAGEHSVVWDGLDDGGREVASGVYLVTLHSAERRVTHKVSLVR